MQRKSFLNKLKRLAKLSYLRLLRIKDSPIKIALGFGLGVFMGVMPGVGPAVAFLLAFILKVNRVSALLGSLLFNTWFSFITLLLAIKIGAVVRGLSDRDVYSDWNGIIQGFKWERLFDVTFYDVFIPISIGYLIISLFFAVLATIVVYLVIIQFRVHGKQMKIRKD